MKMWGLIPLIGSIIAAIILVVGISEAESDINIAAAGALSMAIAGICYVFARAASELSPKEAESEQITPKLVEPKRVDTALSAEIAEVETKPPAEPKPLAQSGPDAEPELTLGTLTRIWEARKTTKGAIIMAASIVVGLVFILLIFSS